MPGGGAAAASASGSGGDFYTAKADSYVPTFSGRQSDYREFKRRCELYAAKMKIAKRETETVFNIVTLLTGRAWDCVDDTRRCLTGLTRPLSSIR